MGTTDKTEAILSGTKERKIYDYLHTWSILEDIVPNFSHIEKMKQKLAVLKATIILGMVKNVF